MRFGSVSLAMTIPDGIEDELTSSSACSASRSCAVWNYGFVNCGRGGGPWTFYLGTRSSTHINHLLVPSVIFFIVPGRGATAHLVVGLYLEEQRRKHTDGLLT